MLHPSIQSSLDILVTRLNQTCCQASPPSPKNTRQPNAGTEGSADDETSPGNAGGGTGGGTGGTGILALLVGTTDGVGLLRSFGRRQTSSPNTDTSSPHLSEETLSNLEGLWATLPSDYTNAGHQLRPLGMGTIRTVTACYDDDTTLMHDVHLSPLVITFVAGPSSNLGAVRAVLPELRRALEPLRSALLEESASASTSLGGGAKASGGGTDVGRVGSSGSSVPLRR